MDVRVRGILNAGVNYRNFGRKPQSGDGIGLLKKRVILSSVNKVEFT